MSPLVRISTTSYSGKLEQSYEKIWIKVLDAQEAQEKLPWNQIQVDPGWWLPQQLWMLKEPCTFFFFLVEWWKKEEGEEQGEGKEGVWKGGRKISQMCWISRGGWCCFKMPLFLIRNIIPKGFMHIDFIQISLWEVILRSHIHYIRFILLWVFLPL